MSKSPFATHRPVSDLAVTLEHIGRALHAAGFTGGLHSVQWSALRYFSRARHELCTVNGLAGYQGTTAAPASRTVSALIRKGLLTSEVNPQDRRSRSLMVTPKGREMLTDDPLHVLDDAIAGLGAGQREAVQQALDSVLETLLVTIADRQMGEPEPARERA